MLNTDKTEMLIVGPAKHKQLFKDVSLYLDGCVIM